MSTPPLFLMDEHMETPTGSPGNPPSSADLDFQTAVAMSMDELDNLVPGGGLEGDQTYRVDSSAVHPSTENPQPAPSAQQAVQEQLRRYQEATQYSLEKRIELPLLDFVGADTLVFIDPPPVTRKGGEATRGGRGCRLAPVDCAPHRMHSERLKATGSAYFIDALGPTKQFRTVRRRRLTSLPPGIKYVIDLTPPEEGDIAVELTTELSCSNGVRQWFFTAERWEILAGLVGGHDDFEEKNIIEQARYRNPPAAPAGDGTAVVKKQGKAPIPMDYTAVRHHSAIERVLNIIERLPPRIDSAPKMWSVFCVAKFLDCTSVVKDDVLSWIYGERNERFIETLPEVSLKIAEGLQNYMLCRDAFSILVGEEAMASIGKEISGKYWMSRARRGREGLDLDSFVTRVEYASKAFAERVNTTFTELADCGWIAEASEYRRISQFLETYFDGNCDAINTLSNGLRSFVRARIYSALSVLFQVSGYFPSSFDRIGEDLFSCKSHAEVYGGIQHKEALLIRDYWMPLLDENLLAQNVTSLRAEPHVAVFGIGNKFHGTTWSELMAETEKFNWLITEMATKNNTSVFAPGPVGSLQSIPGPTKSNSGSSAKLEAGSINSLPIRPKHGHKLSVPDVPGTTGTKDLPIRPKSWIQTPTPSAVLNAGSSGCIAIPREADGPHLPSFEGLGGTVDPRDIAIVQQKQEMLNGCGEMVRDLKAWAASLQRQTSRTQSGSSGAVDNTGYRAHGATHGVDYPYNNRLHFHPFNVHTFLGQCRDHIRAVVRNMIKPSISFDPAITDTLLSLDENEFQYLPLYAGGNDDGSGGVFDEPIPNAVTGPIGPGPKYHIGMGSAASSEFDMVDAGSVVSSSFDTSMGVEDGYSDHLDRRNVYSDDGMTGFDAKGKEKAREIDDDYDDMGEDLTVVGHDSDEEEEFCDVEDDLMFFT